MPDALISYEFSELGLRDALEALGTTADAVARNLVAMGFKGVREEPCKCPVAKYLLGVIEGIDGVNVDMDDALIGRGEDSQSVKLPRPVRYFIGDFDSGGMYRQLEAPDASS